MSFPSISNLNVPFDSVAPYIYDDSTLLPDNAWDVLDNVYQVNLAASAATLQQAFAPSPPPENTLGLDFQAPPSVAGSPIVHGTNLVAPVPTPSPNTFLHLLADVALLDAELSGLVPRTRSPTPDLEYPPAEDLPESANSPAPRSPSYHPRTPTPDPAVHLYNHLFDLPPCLAATSRHPHLYRVFYESGDHFWAPQADHLTPNFLEQIPRVQDLEFANPNFVTPFRGLTYHDIRIPATDLLPSITLCAKIGLHPSSPLFPFGYIETSFIDSIKHLFAQFPPVWLQYFEDVQVPLLAYDFLDGRLITITGHLHFTEDGIFVVNRLSRVEDILRTRPDLARFCCTPRSPLNPFLHVFPPRADLPL